MITRFGIMAILALALLGCRNEQEQLAGGEPDEVTGNEITLSEQQMNAAAIRTGSIGRATINRGLALNGVMEVPPQSLITISPPAEGFVRDIRVRDGMKVRRGDLLLSLENMAFIQMQQDYLENKSKLEFLSAEYERQKVLANENINSGKALQQAKSNYEATLSATRGLEARLKMLGISVDRISGGDITSRIAVYAPTDGYVSGVVEGTGHFVQTTETLLRIVNTNEVQLILQIFEKDLASIAEGQPVEFRLPDDTTRYTAKVSLIGKELTPERTIRVQCNLNQKSNRFVPGMFVTANIILDASEVDALPVESVVSWGTHYGIFLREGDNRFRLQEVATGPVNGSLIEVKVPDGVDKNSQVVISGARHLLGMLKNNPED